MVTVTCPRPSSSSSSSRFPLLRAGLDVLLESGLPWGIATTVERSRHCVTSLLAPNGGHASTDALRLQLEGGATATIPLARTLLRKPCGSALIALQSPMMHKAIKISWEAEKPQAAQGDDGGEGLSGYPGDGGGASGMGGWRKAPHGGSAATMGVAASLLSLLTSTTLISAIAIAFALLAPDANTHASPGGGGSSTTPTAIAAAAAAAAAVTGGSSLAATDKRPLKALSSSPASSASSLAPALGLTTRRLLLAAGVLLLLLEIWPVAEAAMRTLSARLSLRLGARPSSADKAAAAAARERKAGAAASGGGAAASVVAVSVSPLRHLAALVRRLPTRVLTRLPAGLSRTIAAAELPAAWNLTFEPATLDRDGNPALGSKPNSPSAMGGATAGVGWAPHSPGGSFAGQQRGVGSPPSPLYEVASSVASSPSPMKGGEAWGFGGRTASPSTSPSTMSAGVSRTTTPEADLQMDALFADVASAEHSILFHAAVALRAVRVKMRGPGAVRTTTSLAASSISREGGGGSSGALAEEAYPANAGPGGPGGPAGPAGPAGPGGRSRAATWDGAAPPFLGADAAGANASGGAHAEVHAVSSERLAAEASAAAAAGRIDFELESLLSAFEQAVVAVLASLGPAMLILVKNDEGNLRKMRDAARKMGSASSSVRALIDDELKRGIHKTGEVQPPANSPSESPAHARSPGAGVSFGGLVVSDAGFQGVGGADGGGGGGGGGGAFPPHAIGNGIKPGSTGGATLHDPSAAISLLWLRRSLNFTLLIMENLQKAKQKIDDEAALLPVTLLDDFDPNDPDSGGDHSGLTSMLEDPVCDCVCSAYDVCMRPFHAWILRKTFDLVATQIPSLPQMLACLGTKWPPDAATLPRSPDAATRPSSARHARGLARPSLTLFPSPLPARARVWRAPPSRQARAWARTTSRARCSRSSSSSSQRAGRSLGPSTCSTTSSRWRT